MSGPVKIPMREFQELSLALPKCSICSPEEGRSKILDRRGEWIGTIHWRRPEIHLYTSYEYFDEVMEALGPDKFTNGELDHA